MPTPAERRALLFVAVVATLGAGVRVLSALRAGDAPRSDREALATQIARVDSAIASGGRRPVPRQKRGSVSPNAGPPGDGPAKPRREAKVQPAPSSIDLDVADAATLDALPGIGPALAARIVADRDANGPFGSLEAVQRVKGVGPALTARIAPYVTFSHSARQIPMVPACGWVTCRP